MSGNRGNFHQPGVKIEFTKKKSTISIQSADKKPSIVIQHQVKIDRPNTPNQGFPSPVKVNRPLTPNPVYQNPPHQFQTPAVNNNPSISNNNNAISNTNFAQNKQASQVQPQKTVQPPPAQPAAPAIPQHDAFCRLSLLSFVSSFEDQKTFNETDLMTLGLDLKCQEPLLPMLHSILSDAPLLDHSRHPMPECYSKISQAGKPQEKLTLFSDQTLLFIFYTYPRDPLQIHAANELIKRGFSYDEELEEWRNRDGFSWSVDQWKEMEEVEQNDSVMNDD